VKYRVRVKIISALTPLRRTMRSLISLLSIPMLILSTSILASENNKIDAPEIFSQLKSLVGVWEKQGATDSNFTISFELTANDTTLIETWNYKGRKHSLTLYHLNGKSLMATHYCPQGNQPRLNLSNDATLNNISFNYFDATNLESLEDSHQHTLGFELYKSSDKILRKETCLSKSGEEESDLLLVRK